MINSFKSSVKRGMMNKNLVSVIVLSVLVAQSLLIAQAPLVQAQTQPNENINNSSFKLAVCDGPAGANLNNVTPYTPCDYHALFVLAQHIINIMIIVGVLAAMILFSYTGYLYITGTPANITKAKGIFPKVAIGFIIMLTAWFIVYQILAWLTPTPSNYLGG